MSDNLDTLKAELESLHTQRDIAQARLDLRQLTQAAEHGSLVLEAWGDMIDPREYLYDDPNFGRYTAPISRADDRKGGMFRPVFETESELAMIRGAAHVMTTSFASGWNILENLTNYTIAEGYEHECVSEENPRLAEVAQEVLETFFDDNDWQADLERELHWRTREDGEAALILRPKGWRAQASFIEPDWITQPADSRELEDWLAHYGGEYAGDYVPCWLFGVHCRASDTSRALGYHAVYDGSGNDWEYFPANDVVLARQLGTGVLELVKRNVPRNVKRGVSDFYPVLKRLERAEKLSTNVETTSAIQAAIAFIREHAPTATPGQITSLASGSATQTYNKALPDGSTRSTRRQKFEPGTIVDTNGTKYLHGPMGQNNAPTFVDVIEAALRLAGSRWEMPEYMITANAENANLASTLVQGAPFVKAREADQRFYKSRFHHIDWKVLRIAYEGGRFQEFGMTWEEIEAALTVKITPPDITIANELEQASIKQIEHQAGVLSSKTWIKESGRDVEEETKNLEEEKAQKQADFEQQQMQAGMGGGRGGFGASRNGNGGQPSARPFAETLLENCGTGAGGFQPGNKCAGDGGMQKSRVRRKKLKVPQVKWGILTPRERESLANAISAGGLEYSIEEIPAIVGAQDGAAIDILDVNPDDGTYRVIVQHNDYYAERRVDGANIENANFFVEPEAQGKGLGTKVFAEQIESARAAGFKAIETTAARGVSSDGVEMNGYYTWARLGYDGPIHTPGAQAGGGTLNRNTAAQLGKILGASQDKDGLWDFSGYRISDLMRTAEGRAWWKANGWTSKMRFSLEKNSISSRVIDAYIQEKANRRTAA